MLAFICHKREFYLAGFQPTKLEIITQSVAKIDE